MFFVVTGGSGSGKSAFAEKLTASLGEGRRIYIATMMCFDEEGKKRISRHRAMRADKHFETLERYTDLCGLEVPEVSILLLECMSNLVANEMFPPVDASGIQAAEAEKEALDAPENMKDYEMAQISRVSKMVLREVSILSENVAELVIVTNNVFEDGVSYDQSTMNYIKAMGIVNRGLAAMAERVVEVVAGIPVTVK